MNMTPRFALNTVLSLALSLTMACDGKQESSGESGPEAAPVAKVVNGVDMDGKIVHVGALNDESGPGATIGKPYAIGKQLIARRVNAGGSGLLPDGWKIEMHEKDHGYNPNQSVQAYNQIKDDVLYVATSFGTPNTSPLRPLLQRDKIVAFPASLSSEMAANEFTPPLTASYKIEARRAMDWVVTQNKGSKGLKAAVVYQQDDYGADGRAGWKEAAELHGVTIVSEQAVAPGQTDFTAVITALKESGANYVYLCTLPSATGPLMGTAAQLKFMPNWIGSTPSWIDRFFSPEVIPAAVFTNFYWAVGLPYWGEDVPGMSEFLSAYESFGKELHGPDFYILASYIQGLSQVEAFNVALKSGDTSREGYLAALHTLQNFDAGGMIQPINMGSVPYKVGTSTRLLKPKMAESTWEVVAEYAEPMTEAYAGAGSKKATAKRRDSRSRNGSTVTREGSRGSKGGSSKGSSSSKDSGTTKGKGSRTR